MLTEVILLSLGHVLAVATQAPSTTLGGLRDDLSSTDSSLCMLQRDSQSMGLKVHGVEPSKKRTTPWDCGSPDAASSFSTALQKPAFFWSNKNGDASCSGASPYTSPFEVSQGPAWSFRDEAASIVSTHPCIDSEKNIYLGHRNGNLRKFSREGVLLWTNSDNFAGSVAQKAVGGCVLHNGAIFTGSTDGSVAAVDMATGETLWHKKVAPEAGPDSWSLSAISGLVVVAMRNIMQKDALDFGGNDEIIALSATDGGVVWRWTVPDDKIVYNFLGSFADDPPSLMFSNAEGRPYRLRLCDGSVVWEGPAFVGNPGEVPGMSTGGMALGHSGLAYVTSNSVASSRTTGILSAYNVSTGALVWSRRQGMPANNAPVVGRLAGPSDKPSVVIALGQNPGFPNPAAAATGRFADGTPVAWLSELLAFDAMSGEPTGWHYTPPPHRKPQADGDRFPNHICLPDAWSNGAIDGHGTFYVGHMSGNLFALQDVNGDGKIEESQGEVEKYYGGRCYQGSPGIAPGTLVATPCDGMHVFSAS